jgi:Holliday junction DNA helicase RuvA
MIGRLHGTLLRKQPPELLLDVHGVGYEISAPMSTFYQLPETGATVTLHTHLVVREDAHLLFGFASETERQLFRALLKVSGVGPKVALAILSGISVDDFVRCVQANDAARLVRLPGIGKKTAERLLIEMRDRIEQWGSGATVVPGAAPVATPLTADSAVKEALAALVALGYSPPEASKMLAKIDTAQRSSEQIIRAALQSAIK